jgi:hypothetical protein
MAADAFFIRSDQEGGVSVQEAIATLERAGFTNQRHWGLRAVAERLDFSVDWVRDHLDEFPNAWRAPGGELRIPVRDVEALAARCKLRREAS